MGEKTSLAVSGLKTFLDLPMNGIGKLETTIMQVFAEQFPDGGSWTDLYDATNIATASERKKKGANLDRTAFTKALYNLIETKDVLDDAPGIKPRPKGALYRLLKIQPGHQVGLDTGTGSVGGREDRSVWVGP